MKTQPIKPSKAVRHSAIPGRYEQLKSGLSSKNDPYNKVGGTQNIGYLLQAIKKKNTKSHESNLTAGLLKAAKITEKPFSKSRNGIDGPVYKAMKLNDMDSSKSRRYETKQNVKSNKNSSNVLQTYSSARPMNLSKPISRIDKLITSSSSSSCKIDFNKTAIVKKLAKK